MLTLAPRLSSTLSPGGAMPAAEVVIPACVICASKIFVRVLKKYLRQVVTRIVRDVEEQHERRRGWVRRCDHMKEGDNITCHGPGTNLPHRGHLEQLRLPAGLWLLQQPGTARSYRHNDDDNAAADDDNDDDDVIMMIMAGSARAPLPAVHSEAAEQDSAEAGPGSGGQAQQQAPRLPADARGAQVGSVNNRAVTFTVSRKFPHYP